VTSLQVRLDDRDLIPNRERESFSLALCRGQLWGPPNLLSNGYRALVLVPWLWSGWGMKLTTHFHLVPRLRMCGFTRCLQKFLDWPPGVRTADGTAVTRCSCIAILWVSLVSSVAITLCVTSQRVFVVVDFVIDSVRKLLVAPSYHLSPIHLYRMVLN
jgi:hypothetical protein